MNAKEVAKMLGLHPNTIYKMIKNGEIQAIKQGKSFDIPNIEVGKLMVSKNSVDLNKETKKGVYTLIQHYECKISSEFIMIATHSLGVAQEYLKLNKIKNAYERTEKEVELQNSTHFVELLKTVEKYVGLKKMCEDLKETIEDPLLNESFEEQVAWHNSIDATFSELVEVNKSDNE